MTVSRLPSTAPARPYVNIDGWSPPVQSAELARGTLVRCGPGVRLAAWPESAEVRAQVLRRVIGDTLMPVLMSAAWVWGCARDPGTPLVCATKGSTRPKLEATGPLRVHEFRYPQRHLAQCGDTVLPNPTRTACDLVRLSAELTPEVVVAIRLLVLQAAVSREAWELALRSCPSRHRVRALARIAVISS